MGLVLLGATILFIGILTGVAIHKSSIEGFLDKYDTQKDDDI